MSNLIKNMNKNESGLGLVETILAIGIGVVVITALVSLSVFTLRSSQNSKYLLQSSKLANEELELVRAYRDSSGLSWADFVNSLSGCYSDKCNMPSSAASVNATSGTDEIETLDPSPSVNLQRWFNASKAEAPYGALDGSEDVVRISVTVQWNVGDDQKTTHTYTDISNWRGN